jgi:hypothetical protein
MSEIYLITMAMTIQQRINHFKGLRRFIEVKPGGTHRSKKIQKVDKFKRDPVYLGTFNLVSSNLSLLKSCYKSGSWVRMKCLGRERVFWTSRKLKYFTELPDARTSRNFGVGIITESQMTIFHYVTIDHNYPTNSLNIYNHRIAKGIDNFEIDEAFYLCVNGANNFQHFVQDFLPILVSIRNNLNEKPDLPIILNGPSMEFQKFDPFFNLLKISNPRIYVDGKSIGTKKLYFLDFKPKNRIYCLPSEMYKDLFDAVLHEKVFKENKKQNLVCFVRNEKTRNFANIDFVKKELSNWASIHGLNPVFINPVDVNFNDLVDFLSNAKFVFGAHGGAIYNMVFAAKDSTLIEFVATDSTDSLMHMIRSFGQNYLPYAVKMDKGSFSFEVSKKDFEAIFARLEENI